MPIYTFRKRGTEEEFTEWMSIADRERYLNDNPDIEQIIVQANGFVTSNGFKPDDTLRDIFREVKKVNPGSTIETY